MNQPPQNAPNVPGQSVVHRCFTQDPGCSGCAPCNGCLDAIKMGVLPVAFARAGLGQLPEVMTAFVDAFSGEGWTNLHTMMLQASPHIPPFAQIPIGQLLHERLAMAQERQGMLAEIARLTALVAGSAGASQPSEPSEAVEVPQTLNGAVNAAANGVVPEVIASPLKAPERGDIEEIASQPVTPRVLTADDVAAARMPIAGSAVLGNVMVIPPGFEHIG